MKNTNASSGMERRRAMRILPTNVEVSLTIGQNVLEHVPLIDLSTLGIGVILETLPVDPVGKFKFKHPGALRGLVIKAQKRFEQEQKRDDGSSSFRVGYEFLFSSAEQQNQLLRWLCDEMHGKLQDGMPKANDPQKQETGGLNLEVRFPQNEIEFEKCLELVKPLTVYHAMMQTKFFMAMENGNIIAVLPLFQDIFPFRMPAEEFFPGEVHSVKSRRGRFGEIGSMYLNKDLSCLQGMNLAPWYRFQILMGLFRHIFFYAKHFAQLTHLVAMSTPPLEELYRLWLFEEEKSAELPFFQKADKGEKESKNKNKLVWINLDNFESRAPVERPEILSWMVEEEKREKGLENLAYSFYPGTPLIRKWFCEEYPVFGTLKPHETRYFRFCFPDFFPSHS